MNLGNPMLAADCKGDVSKLRYPGLASPKLDGVRAIVTTNGLVSRSLKPIPNQHVQYALRHVPVGFDGELIVGEPTHPECYRRTVSAVMSDDKPIDGLMFHVFDTMLHGEDPFAARLERVRREFKAGLPPTVCIVPHDIITTEEALLAYEARCLDLGYEGVMFRDPNALYKQGRSTLKEGWLVKVKRFVDAEGVIIGVKELMHNDNAAFTNELGRTDRSTHQAGKRGGGMLGAVTMLDANGEPFECGTGFTLKEREDLWAIRSTLPGRYGKYKHFPIGGKDKPRHPVWIGFRDPIDMEVAA